MATEAGLTTPPIAVGGEEEPTELLAEAEPLVEGVGRLRKQRARDPRGRGAGGESEHEERCGETGHPLAVEPARARGRQAPPAGPAGVTSRGRACRARAGRALRARATGSRST